MLSSNVVEEFWKSRSENIRGNQASRFHPEHTPIDQGLIKILCRPESSVLDLGCGDCIISNWLVSECGASVRAVDKQHSFLQAAIDHPNLHKEVADAAAYPFFESYDMILMMGLINFIFNPGARFSLYKAAVEHLKTGGSLLIKSQFGIDEDVEINTFSEALNAQYCALYPHIDSEVELLKKVASVKVEELYPPEMNPHKNTKFFHIVAKQI